MRFPDRLLDDIRSRLPVSAVAGRKVSLKKQGREFVGLSPFKAEKTPSFFVNDHKGFYHCFASGEHGDIFTFLMKTEGLSFPEAVERLAAEAGVALPKESARTREEAREGADSRTRLYLALEAAARFFTGALASPAGREARAYLEKRGVTAESIARFRLGYAPSSRTALREHLAAAGFTSEEMSKAGLLITGPDIPTAYDRFRHRLMFPIEDLKGRVVAFGGRALDHSQTAKYLNSPETPLFHKGALLFNAARAREKAHERGRIVAVEGYMDVIALFQAGVPECVAPLGTALTEEQVKLLWRFAPEPVLCFDGDSAGRRAAFRAVDTVLPHLKPGLSLVFAFLPEGLDPDDLVRQQGAAAIEPVLKQARSLADVLWEREWSSGEWTTPERRARLETQLRGAVARIGDPAVRSHYEREFRQRLYQVWRAPSGYKPHRQAHAAAGAQIAARAWRRTAHAGEAFFPRRDLPPQAGASLKASGLVAGGALPPREVHLVASLLAYPWLLESCAEEIAALVLTSVPLRELRDALLATYCCLDSHESLDRETLQAQLRDAGLDKTLTLAGRAVAEMCGQPAPPDGTERARVEKRWRHSLVLHERQTKLQGALEAAAQAWHETCDEEAFARMCELHAEIARLESTEIAGDGESAVGEGLP